MKKLARRKLRFASAGRGQCVAGRGGGSVGEPLRDVMKGSFVNHTGLFCGSYRPLLAGGGGGRRGSHLRSVDMLALVPHTP